MGDPGKKERNNKMVERTPWRELVKTPTRQRGQDRVHNISHLPTRDSI